ncbi:MAG: hypothetical protein WBM13_02965 [Bacteroidia bacterium]|jgi:hypothetical protein
MEETKIISEQSNQRKKFSETEKAEYCEAWKQSEKPMSKFCREKGLSFQTFYGWLNRKRNREKLSKGLFIPVDTSIDKSTRGENLKIKFPNGCEVYFSDIKEESKVLKLLEGLRDAIANA